jgi:hypothetical protein
MQSTIPAQQRRTAPHLLIFHKFKCPALCRLHNAHTAHCLEWWFLFGSPRCSDSRENKLHGVTVINIVTMSKQVQEKLVVSAGFDFHCIMQQCCSSGLRGYLKAAASKGVKRNILWNSILHAVKLSLHVWHGPCRWRPEHDEGCWLPQLLLVWGVAQLHPVTGGQHTMPQVCGACHAVLPTLGAGRQ